jgi:hypothetical protein
MTGIEMKQACLPTLLQMRMLVGFLGERVQCAWWPTAVGSIKDIDSTDTLKAIAAAYFSAFTQNTRTYPYLVG